MPKTIRPGLTRHLPAQHPLQQYTVMPVFKHLYRDQATYSTRGFKIQGGLTASVEHQSGVSGASRRMLLCLTQTPDAHHNNNNRNEHTHQTLQYTHHYKHTKCFSSQMPQMAKERGQAENAVTHQYKHTKCFTSQIPQMAKARGQAENAVVTTTSEVCYYWVLPGILCSPGL